MTDHTSNSSIYLKKRTREDSNEIIDNKLVRNNDEVIKNNYVERNLNHEEVNKTLHQLTSQISYVTGPEITRKYFQLDLASENEKTDEDLIRILSNNLQESDEKIIFYIAGFKSQCIPNKNNDNKIIYKCDICLFTIAKVLVSQLLGNGIKQIYYFIGNWKQEDKFMISSYRPDDSTLAKTSNGGVELPFESALLNFETVE